MVEGLEINNKQFTKLPVKEQNAILLENLQKIINLMESYAERFEKHEELDKYQFKSINRIIGIGSAIITTIFGSLVYIIFNRLSSK